MFYRHWAFLISPLRVWDVLSDPRNIGSGSPLKIKRGLNALWKDGGLQYAMPIR